MVEPRVGLAGPRPYQIRLGPGNQNGNYREVWMQIEIPATTNTVLSCTSAHPPLFFFLRSAQYSAWLKFVQVCLKAIGWPLWSQNLTSKVDRQNFLTPMKRSQRKRQRKKPASLCVKYVQVPRFHMMMYYQSLADGPTMLDCWPTVPNVSLPTTGVNLM